MFQPTHRRRIVFFGGQGSRSLFSQKVSSQLKKSVAISSNLALLLSSCHTSLLNEIVAVRSKGPVPKWADLDEVFRTQETLLAMPEQYWKNPIVQGVILCLYQLLTQLQQQDNMLSAEGVSVLQPPAGVIGFCSGMIPAIVLASSETIPEYIERSREAIRLAYWIGYRAAEVSRKIAGEGNSWSTISVSGIGESDIKSFLKQSDANNTSLHLATRFGSNSWSLGGPAPTIQQFRERYLTKYDCEIVHVYALYHGGSDATMALQNVMADVKERDISFPTLSDLRHNIRIWSAHDGSCLNPEFPPAPSASPIEMTALLECTLSCILVEQADLYTTCVELGKWLRNFTPSNVLLNLNEEEENGWDVTPIGPGSHALLSSVMREVVLPKTKITEPLWSDEMGSDQDGFAIVGMSINFPWAANKAEFWKLLEEGLNTVTEIPKTRFNVEDYQQNAGSGEEKGNSRMMAARHGNFLEVPFEFDHEFFNISPRESISMDPQQKLLLQGAVRALDDAGYVPNATPSFQSETMGCYIGVATQDYVQNLVNDIDVYYATGTLRAFFSGKISYTFGWSGPSIVVDTACSSSLVSIALACRALADGDCTAALVGGVNAITSPDMHLGLSRAHFLNQTGQCKPFDVTADGYSRAEGCGLFVIKRLSDAVLENDRIYGVIRGVEMNQSGNASSITHPHAPTQRALFQKLFRKTGLNPSSISVVEAHGTGTQAGDAVEASSIEQTFSGSLSPDPIILTSVKANIGHAEAAAGSASLAKLLMMMQRKKIPPQAGFKSLNPKLIGLASKNIRIVTESQDWAPANHKSRRALLNNFGAAGSNAALIVEEFQGTLRPKGFSRAAYNLNISAKSETALQKLLNLYHEMLSESSSMTIEDFCYTVTARRQAYNWRTSLVCRTLDELIEKLGHPPSPTHHKPGTNIPVVFVFSGQGSFYPGMGNQLLSTVPEFRETVQHCDSILVSLGYPEIIPVLRGDQVPEGPEESIVLSQVACFVLGYALGSLWLSWNVKPDFVIGHSLGEYVALALSEVISLKDALWLVSYRAELMRKSCRVGETAMLACNRSPSYLTNLFQSNASLSNLIIACENSSTDSVVSGPSEEISTLSSLLKDQGSRCKKLDVPLGFHSAALDPILEPLGVFCSQIHFSKPKFAIGSCYYGRLVDHEDLIGEYFIKQVRGVVRFADLVSSLPIDNVGAFIEIGAAPITLPMVKNYFSSSQLHYLPSLKKDQDDWETLCSSLQTLSLTEIPINWPKIFDGTAARIIDLPEYPFQQISLYVPYHEHVRNNIPLMHQPDSFHLLVDKISSKSVDHPKVFRSSLKALSTYIQGHVVGGSPLCPASVYHEMIVEACVSDSMVEDSEVVIVKDVVFQRPLLYHAENDEVPIFLTIDHVAQFQQTSQRPMWQFSFSSGTRGQSEAALAADSMHCAGRMLSCTKVEVQKYLARKAAYIQRQINHLEANKTKNNVFRPNIIYNMIFNRVVTYSKKYQAIEKLTVTEGGLEGFGTFRLPDEALKDRGILSPVFVDTLLHAAGFVANSNIQPSEACICAQVENIRMLYDDIRQDQTFSFYCSLLKCNDDTMLGEAYALINDGTVVAAVEGMHFKKLNLKSFQAHLERQRSGGNEEGGSITVLKKSVTMQHPIASSKPKERPQKTLEKTKQHVADIISQICQQPISSLVPDKKLADLGFDSLMWLELSASLGSHFENISFDSDTLNQTETIGAIQDYILARQSVSLDDKQSKATQSLVVEDNTASSQRLNPEFQSPDPSEGSSDCSAPSPDAMDTLASVISKLCGTPQNKVSPEQTLGSLGIDSLMFIELKDSLQEIFGKPCLPVTMNSQNTLQVVAAALCSTPDSSPPDSSSPSNPDFPETRHLQAKSESKLSVRGSLYPLQIGARDIPPLILFHDGSGAIEMYRCLSHVGCNVMGIGNPDLRGTSHWASSLKEMASVYASAIEASASGRVVLAGWSFGGILAHEVAQQLQTKECSAIGVILIDSPCPINHQPLPRPVIDYVLNPILSKSDTTNINPRAGMPTITSQFSHHARFLSEYNSNNCNAAGERVYVMLQSEDCFDTTKLCGVKYPWLEDNDSRLESISQWEKILGRQISVLKIPGNHFEPFKPANVNIVSEKLRQAYRAVFQSVLDSI